MAKRADVETTTASGLKPTNKIPRLFQSSIQEALHASKVYMVYQPIVDLRAHRTFAYEALIRSDIDELASPLELLAAAVQQGQLGLLGRVARQLACRGCPHMPLFLNLHPDELDEAYLLRPDEPAAMHTPGAYLEITESVPLSHYRFCATALSELRARGVGLAIDDFGAGFSNVRYLADIGPDVVKLDRELICGLRAGTRMFALVRSIVQMCAAQGALVVAEGVETREELHAITRAGVPLAQGYLLARPQRIAVDRDWSRWLEDHGR